MRKLIEKKIVLATHNIGKVKEMQTILAPFGITVLSADDLSLTEPEETGKTFIENARIKAVSAAKEAGIPALGDDSGLCVHALDNRPGIYSARYNEPKKKRLYVRDGTAERGTGQGKRPFRPFFLRCCYRLA